MCPYASHCHIKSHLAANVSLTPSGANVQTSVSVKESGNSNICFSQCLQFAVVNFLEENSVAVVPRTWLENSSSTPRCYYPPSGWPRRGSREVQLRKATKSISDPDVNWPLFDVKVMHLYSKYSHCSIRNPVSDRITESFVCLQKRMMGPCKAVRWQRTVPI